MLNIQRTIIVCILFAAISAQPKKICRDLTDDEKERVGYLVDSLEHVRNNSGLRDGGIDHFKTWSRWGDIHINGKLYTLNIYETTMKEAGLGFRSGTNQENKNKLGRLAYKALDSFIQREFRIVVNTNRDNPTVIDAMQLFLEHGRFLDYYASKFRKSFDVYLSEQAQWLEIGQWPNDS